MSCQCSYMCWFCPTITNQCSYMCWFCPTITNQCSYMCWFCPTITNQCSYMCWFCPTITNQCSYMCWFCPTITNQCSYMCWFCPTITNQCSYMCWFCPTITNQCSYMVWFCPTITNQCSYMCWFCPTITNLLMVTSSCMSLGATDNFSSASVSSGSTVQIAMAVFLPCPVKLDTVSHSVRAWNISSNHSFSGLRHAAISWAARYRKLLAVPKVSNSPSSGCSPWATDTANTTTSLSTIWIIILWCPCWAGCTQQHATASVFMHGASEARPSSGDLLRTASPSVMKSCLCFWSSHLRGASDSNLSSSVLLLSTRRKFCQFPGIRHTSPGKDSLVLQLCLSDQMHLVTSQSTVGHVRGCQPRQPPGPDDSWTPPEPCSLDT